MKHNWEYKRLGDVCKIVNGFAFKSELFKDSGMPILRIANIQNDTITTDALVFCNPSDYKTDLSKFLVKSDDLVMALSGATTGKIGINKTNIEFYLNQRVALFKDIIISRRYLFYFLKTEGKNILESAFGVAQPNVSTSKLTELYIPVPTQNVQEQIVAELDKINETIEDCRELLRNLDALAQSLFNDYFGDPAINPKGWQTKSLDEICEAISTGITYKPDNVADFGTIVLRSSNIQNSSLVLDDIVRIDMPLKPSQYVQKNDILMCSRNGSARLVGKVALIPELKEKMSWGAFMTIIRSNYYHFLFQYFRLPAFREQLTKTKTTTVNQITIGMLKKIHLPVPPLSLQKKFAERIEQIEAQKKIVESTIAELQTLLDSRMDYWFN